MTMTVSRPELFSKVDVSAFEPAPPPIHHEPLKIAEDTYLIRQVAGEGHSPTLFYINSMVILGKEPVIVDTNTAHNREAYLNDVFSLVDPLDVRWVFLSHDDHDHVGNLAEVMALCPNATLVSSWFQVERLSGDIALPPHRMRWLSDGDSFDAGDRTFAAIRPPVFDSPTSRGLYDSKTGVYWAGDCFASAVSTTMDDVSGMHPEEWRQGFDINIAISPWLEMVDAVRFDKSISRLQSLDIKAIGSGHSPAILGDYVGSAIDMLYDLANKPQPPLPGQETLDAIIAQLLGQPQA